jgi:hypothetical protein
MNWAQLAYQYGVGGAFFALSLALCFRPGAANRSNESDRRTLLVSVVGLLVYLALTAGWIAAVQP